jgi:AcrR family transcriptional regulator
MRARAAVAGRPDSAWPRLRKAERRASIVASAAAAFAQSGYTATSMADVSRAAGVSHLIVYRHFDSKEQLYETVLHQARDNLERMLDQANAIGRLGPRTAALLRCARLDENAFEVLWRHAAHERGFSHHADAARHRLEGSACEALQPIVPSRYVRWAARATMSLVVQSVLIWVEEGERRHDERFVAATDAALRAGVRSWSEPVRRRRGDGS